MFWKIANLTRIKSWSLAAKLILCYSLTTTAIVAAACSFLFPAFEKIKHLNNNYYQDGLFSSCIEKFIIALVLSTFSAIILGYIITRNGMKHVGEFSDKMEKITADSLADRINPNDWPKELKPLSESFTIMLDRLQKSFNQLSQFSSDIAHELRNPIHNLTGITEVALSKENSVEKYREILESNIEEYHHLTKLIENLLFLARSDHGQITINKKTLDARQEILKIFDYYQPIADENKIEMICDGDAFIYVDQNLFKRVISNLLSNAIRYTSQGGRILIKIESLSDSICISINDTGMGIEEIHLAKIFDRFYRVDPSRSLQTGGLGLGLAIVKSIVNLHRGRISITSQLNIGTSVHLQLPSLS
jgi:two-component system, OmpR family, heavy metal sensor histidine kinase CusS